MAMHLQRDGVARDRARNWWNAEGLFTVALLTTRSTALNSPARRSSHDWRRAPSERPESAAFRRSSRLATGRARCARIRHSDQSASTWSHCRPNAHTRAVHSCRFDLAVDGLTMEISVHGSTGRCKSNCSSGGTQCFSGAASRSPAEPLLLIRKSAWEFCAQIILNQRGLFAG